MEGLALNLILLTDTRGKIIFAKGYDHHEHTAVEVPRDFLEKLLSNPRMAPEAVARAPQNGLLGFPDAVYLPSTRPILLATQRNSARLAVAHHHQPHRSIWKSSNRTAPPPSSPRGEKSPKPPTASKAN
jgi:sensor domain CHASE-containing protein